MKFTRRIAIVGASAAMAAGVMAVGGGPAVAATPHTPGHHHAAAGAERPSAERHHDARQPTDPWIEDQLATFYPSSAQRLAVFDPWVEDQLVKFGDTTK
ncbi:hypothetical protein SAMN05216532_7372 [Streptomyces sp. 2231.1]|uniref:hypothetical protein n=1 Tax=Streptomyces sp. 2231.1 TaxID=1855347 RepID=UPI00089A38EC|nr:hypothetical protein [Streptomyces sp. 2231.1]SEE21728.1 hypothetical protein SAMN05216532_7372 [Streptomyces sp. 2231.1]